MTITHSSTKIRLNRNDKVALFHFSGISSAAPHIVVCVREMGNSEVSRDSVHLQQILQNLQEERRS